MKDSGVEWIGKILVIGNMERLSFLWNIKTNPFKSENMLMFFPIIKVTSIKKLKINNPKTFFKESLMTELQL